MFNAKDCQWLPALSKEAFYLAKLYSDEGLQSECQIDPNVCNPKFGKIVRMAWANMKNMENQDENLAINDPKVLEALKVKIVKLWFEYKDVN